MAARRTDLKFFRDHGAACRHALPPNMRLLIIEDDLLLSRSLAASLREENYAVDTAADGEEGLFKATSSAYDCVVLDGMLPVFDGWEVLRRLRH